MPERLQKILSRHGTPRRKAEVMIQEGRVTVNGAVAVIGQKADAGVDRIAVDGKEIPMQVEKLYFVMNKPVGVVCTMEMRKRAHPSYDRAPRDLLGVTQKVQQKTVWDLLPADIGEKVFPIGRLDADSSGLLLFTNDGELAHRLTHPRFPHEKEYEVDVANVIHDSALQKMKTGLVLDGSKTKLAKIQRLSATKFRIAISEGRNRQVRRMCERVGSDVVSLKRVRIATLTDSALAAGQIRPLAARERDALLKAVGLH